ncbi:glycosyltransferase [Paenibacillus humicola]|uniref:glycosyltransferase n=1 Tax=Paenibacillus humicola TaxID=3110540 RepID=UPI00237C21F9|nr:glycosyltransferase [Paenibacillus humicola]
MKKILFVIDSLSSGGAEKSLISLLSLFDFNRYEVDLLMFSKKGLYLPLIPKSVRVLETPSFLGKMAAGIPELIKKKEFEVLYTRIGASLALRNPSKTSRMHRSQISWKWLSKGVGGLAGEYDAAIAYSQGMPTYFVAEKVRSRKKFCWVNTDYKTAPYNNSFDAPYYEQYDQVVAVSDVNKEVFVREMPLAQKKTTVVYDIVSPELIRSMALQGESFNDGFRGLRLLTIGRLVEVKGYDLAVEACRLLVDRGYDLKWYIIGEGPWRDKLIEMIRRLRLEERVVLLGTYHNPYGFLKQCDIYVQPSRYEGFGLAIAEARVLRKPIVATNFTTVHNQLKNRENGLIVGMTPGEISAGIQELIDDGGLRRDLCNHLAAEQIGTEEEIFKVYKLIEA